MTKLGRTEPAFLILTALVDRPRHGYGIVQEVRQITGGRVDLRVGTLYGALDRLAAEGLVEQDRDEIESGRLRRYHRLTNAGAQALAAEADRMAADAAITMTRLRDATPAAGAVGPDLLGGTA